MSNTSTAMIPQWGDSSKMFSLSTQLITLTETYVTELQNLSSSFAPIQITAQFPQIAAPPVPIEPPSPSLINVTWNVPVEPAAFSLLPPSFTHLFPGPLTAVQPTLNFGSAPASFSGSIPSAPATDFNFVYPTTEVDLPDAPSLLTLDVITFTPFDIPTFTGTVPVLTISAPTPLNYVEGTSYTSDLLDDVTASLELALTSNTDTGLDAHTQQAMWDAAREREYRQQADALAELERMEALGYAFPPGVYIDARIKMQTETNYTIAGLSREIMVKQAEMHLDNVMKSREFAIELEGKWIEYTNQVHQRAFETAKYQTEAMISIYNAQVQAYTARVEGFKATIQAYTAYIQGIEARIEQYKAQIQFEQVKAEINSTLVQQYKLQIEAAETVLDIAKVQVEIIQTRASVEKTKVDVYSAQIQAFVGTVNAYTAQIEGYKAQVETQGVIENVYKTQVEAYTSQVQAGTAQANALVEQYKAQVQGYEAQLEGYKASLQAMVEQARAASEYNQAQVAEYQALVNATATYNETLTKQWQAIINEQLQVTEVSVKTAEANGQLAISQRQLSIDAVKAAGSIVAQIGAAALNAIHWSNTSNWSLANSLSSSFSTTSSTSNNTNINESA